MAYTHFSGPIVSYGYALAGNTSGTTTLAGPSLFYQGSALLDPRKAYNPGISINPLSAPATIGAFLNSGEIVLVDQAPSTKSATALAASQTPAGAGALTLISSSGTGTTVGTTITDFNGNTVANLIALDTAYAPVLVGQTNVFDPTKAIQRAVTITSAGNDSGVNFTVTGYDIYGQKLTQTLAGGNVAAVTTTKTFKYILSITVDGATASTVTAGTADVFGMSLRANRFEYLDIWWNSALITATTGWLTSVATSPSTASLGDVRGTYAVQSAADGTKKLVVMLNPQVADMLNSNRTTYVSLFGVTQV